MSLAEIKSQVLQLPPEEQKELIAFVNGLSLEKEDAWWEEMHRRAQSVKVGGGVTEEELLARVASGAL